MNSQQEVPLVVAAGLTKIYTRGHEQVQALHNVSLSVMRGDFVTIVGPSGSGKTTLLHLLGCMDSPSDGTLRIRGRAVHELSEHDRTRFRRDSIGFVFQHFSLLPTLTVEENVALPALFAGRNRSRRVVELLEQVGMQHRRLHRPSELSGGEMQRVAIARALVNEPALILADEPTGNLDSTTAESMISLFDQLHRNGLALVVATHNPALTRAADHRWTLQDGRLNLSEMPARLELEPCVKTVG